MSCVVSPARSAACLFLLLFGAAVVIGTTARAAHADDAGAELAHSWCIAHSDQQPDCVYDDLVACSFNALLTGGFCVKAEPIAVPAAAAEAVPVRQRRKPPRRKVSASQHDNDKLFREFVRWKETTTR